MHRFDKAVYDLLAADATLTGYLTNGTLGIHLEEAVLGEDPPYVVFSQQADTPVYTFSGRSYENVLYNIRGVTREDSLLAGSIAARIDTVLTDGAPTIAGHDAMYLRKESGIRFLERQGDDRYFIRGAIYRMQGSPS